MVFFFNDLPKGRTRVRYRMFAEFPGRYHILPSMAAQVYFPEVCGASRIVGAAVEDR